MKRIVGASCYSLVSPIEMRSASNDRRPLTADRHLWPCDESFRRSSVGRRRSYLLRRWGQAELLQHTQLVNAGPVFHCLAACEAGDMYLAPTGVLAGGRHAQEITLHGAVPGNTLYNLLSL